MSFFSKFLVVLILLNFFFYNLSSSSKETIYLSYKEFLDKFPDGYPKFIGMGNPKSIGAFKMYLHEFGYKSFDYEGNSIGFKYYISDIEENSEKSNSKPLQSNGIRQYKNKFDKNTDSLISDNSNNFFGSENISNWVKEINRQIEKVIKYPKKAKDRNQSGRLLINISLMPDGKLLNVEIENSSGFISLDKSAVNSINKIKRFKSASFDTKNKIFNFILPITYSLEN